jgi:predicted nucleotidyltransferase
MLRSTIEVDKIAKKTLRLLKHYIKIDAAYLFGSYVNGQPHEYSDIDLAVFSHSVNKMGIEKKMAIHCLLLKEDTELISII